MKSPQFIVSAPLLRTDTKSNLFKNTQLMKFTNRIKWSNGRLFTLDIMKLLLRVSGCI